MSRRAASLIAVAATVMGALAVPIVSGAGPAAAATPSGPPPIAQRSAQGVTADALPTVQIDGVVWSQAVVGNTVYAGGNFANARPAGAAPGTNLTPRNNLLSYNLSTGVLNSSFAPSLNAQALAVVASPDGSRDLRGRQLHHRRRRAARPHRRVQHGHRPADLELRAEPRRIGQRDHGHQHDRVRRR